MGGIPGYFIIVTKRKERKIILQSGDERVRGISGHFINITQKERKRRRWRCIPAVTLQCINIAGEEK